MALSMSRGSTTMFGIVGWDVSIHTLSDIPVMSGRSATYRNRDALGRGDFSSEMPWHLEQTSLA
jgi:hypothetical protein